MWKIRASRIKPYWINQNGNKPHPGAFEVFKENHLEEIKANINFVDFFNAQIVLPNNNINYYLFELTNQTTGEVKFFNLDSTEVVQGNRKIFKVILDIYTTYTLPFILRNQDTNIIQNRVKEWKPEMILREDPLLSQINPIVKKVSLEKNVYPFYREDGKNWYQGKNIELANAENVFKYAVFNKGNGLSYSMFPVFKGEMKIRKAGVGNIIYQSNDWQDNEFYGFVNDHFVKKDAVDQENLVNAFARDDKIVLNYRWPKSADEFTTEKHDLERFTFLNTIQYSINTILTGSLFGKTFVKMTITLMINHQRIRTSNEIVFEKDSGEMVEFLKNWAKENLSFYFIVKSFTQESTYKLEINNSEPAIEQLLKKPEFSNKFLGFYAGPHLLQMPTEHFNFENHFDNKMFYISIEKNGFEINPYNFRINLELTNQWNSKKVSKQVLSKTDIIFRNERINVLKLENQGFFNIRGRLIFSDGFKLIGKQNPLLSVDESTISFGGMLPSANDEYIKSLNAQRNTLNTGYAIVKQQTAMAHASNILDMFKTIGNYVLGFDQPFLGNIGELSRGVGALFSTASTALNGWKIHQQFDNWKKSLVAKFQDARNVQGNTIQPTNTRDASLITYMTNGTEQFEMFEVMNLTDYTKIFLNNYNFLYGYFHPHLTTFKKLLEKPNIYIEIDELSVSKTNNLNITEEPNIWLLIKEQLTNGLNLWFTNNFEILEFPEEEHNE